MEIGEVEPRALESDVSLELGRAVMAGWFDEQAIRAMANEMAGRPSITAGRPWSKKGPPLHEAEAGMYG